MTEFKKKYINPFTDYSFKRLLAKNQINFVMMLKLTDIETNKVFYDK